MRSNRRLRWARAFLAVSLFICWETQIHLAASVPPSSSAFLSACLSLTASPITALFLAPAWLLIAWNSNLWAYGAAALGAAFASWTLAYVSPAYIEHSVVMPQALCLFLFLAQFALRRKKTVESDAWELSCALIGAMYFLSGVEKLRETGISWVSGETVRALVASETIHSQGLLRAVRWAFSSSPLAGRIASTFALLVELVGGPLFVFRRTRPWAGALIVSMHAGVMLMAGIPWALFPFVVAALSFIPGQGAAEAPVVNR